MNKFHLKNPVFLIGLTGVGKSTLGAQLAQVLSCPFIDTDAHIENRCKDTIAGLVQQHGLAFLRKEESRSLEQIIALGTNGIVATGGGLPIIPHAIEKMKSDGLVVYLTASMAMLLRRYNEEERLIFKHTPGNTLAEKVEYLLQVREPFYSQAHITIVVDDLTIEELLEEVINRLISAGTIGVT